MIIGFMASLSEPLKIIVPNRYFQLKMFRLIGLSLIERMDHTKIAILYSLIIASAVLILLWLFSKIKWLNIKIIFNILDSKILRFTTSTLVFLIAVLYSSIFIDMKTFTPNKPNVVWILIDALRADHLGCYGYKKKTSPFIDNFADQSILFENAFSQESYTLASTPSYFTSTYPSVHNVLYFRPESDVLDPRFITIAEVLKNANYKTAAFVFNPSLKAELNIGQGFDLYDDNKKGNFRYFPVHECEETAKKIHEKVDLFLKSNKKRPMFLYLHYRDVHEPYFPPPPYHKLFLPPNVEPVVDVLYRKHIYTGRLLKKEHVDLVISQYDGEIRYTEFYIKKTMKMLENYDINKDNSIIIVTADHGEEFLDYHPGDPGGGSHGRTLYREQIHVPLIISIPGISPKRKRIYRSVMLIDIVPTILDALKIKWRKYDQFLGNSLLPLIAKGSATSRAIYSGGNHGRGIVIDGNWKYYRYNEIYKEGKTLKRYINNFNEKPIFIEELYNIDRDPQETINVISKENTKALKLREKLIESKVILNIRKNARSTKLDDVTKEQLKSLGYL